MKDHIQQAWTDKYIKGAMMTDQELQDILNILQKTNKAPNESIELVREGFDAMLTRLIRLEKIHEAELHFLKKKE